MIENVEVHNLIQKRWLKNLKTALLEKIVDMLKSYMLLTIYCNFKVSNKMVIHNGKTFTLRVILKLIK